MPLENMQKKFEINHTKIKGGCQSGRKVVPHDSKSDLPLSIYLLATKSKDGSRPLIHFFVIFIYHVFFWSYLIRIFA